MALDQSALLEVLDALTAAEVDDRVRQAAQTIYQALIEVELTQVSGAAPNQRTPERLAQRNGHRPRLLAATAGDLELRRVNRRVVAAPHDRLLAQALSRRRVVEVAAALGGTLAALTPSSVTALAGGLDLFATAMPVLVKRSSGSSTRLPTIVVSMRSPMACLCGSGGHWPWPCGSSARIRDPRTRLLG